MALLKKTLSFIAIIFIITLLFDNRITVSGSDKNLFAGTKFREEIVIKYKNIFKFFLTPPFKLSLTGNTENIEVLKNNKVLTIKGFSNGESLIIKIKNGKKTFTRTLKFHINMEDSDDDGFFDLVELNSQEDRISFINWFTSIAKSQFYNLSDNWDEVHRDCAGLVTYSYKEALKKHDLKWLKNYSDLQEQRDVEKYNYPNIPIIGEDCFNSSFGYIPSANASSLMNYNMSFISKDINNLEKGDVLFFYDENYEMPYHSMIYLGEPGYVVYHTGPIDDTNKGEVRMILANDLFKHPDEKWHPNINNKKYLGGFRWRILM